MKRICVLLSGPVKYDSRVVRTIRTLSERARVDLFYLHGSKSDEDLFDDNVRLFSIRRGPSVWSKLLRHSFFYLEHNFFVKEVLRAGVRYDVIYANDLPTLYPASKLTRILAARLIYDSHEIYVETLNQFFPARGGGLKSAVFKVALAFMRYAGRIAEGRMLRRVDTFITVNQSLANYFRRVYGVEHVEILMNCPVKQAQPALPAVDFRMLFGWTTRDVVMVYQGVINKGRGYETLFQAMTLVDTRVKLVAIGEGFLKDTLIELAKKLEVEDRIKFLGQVPQESLPGYTAAADFGINFVGLEGFNLSKKLASPNKLFEYMHAGIPVLAASTIENRRVFEEYDIGVLAENDVKKVAEAITAMTESERLEAFRNSSLRGAEKYNWQEQSKVLTRLLA